MATPKGLQDLFQSSGTSTILREDIIPKIYLPLNGGGTVKGNVTVNGAIKGTQLTLNNGSNKNLDFVSPDGLGGGFILASEDHTTNSWVKVLTVNSTDTVNGLSPVGTLISYAGTSIPKGWLLCNGSAVSRTTYSRLFSIIGTKYGTGNGSSTFNLPNCNGRVLQGTTTSGSVGTYLSAGLPNIIGTFDGNTDDGQSKKTGAFYNTGIWFWGANGDGNDSGVIGFNASLSNPIYGASTTVQPPALQTYILIKY